MVNPEAVQRGLQGASRKVVDVFRLFDHTESWYRGSILAAHTTHEIRSDKGDSASDEPPEKALVSGGRVKWRHSKPVERDLYVDDAVISDCLSDFLQGLERVGQVLEHMGHDDQIRLDTTKFAQS